MDRDSAAERGQVGIGTLIVFIALVLVAAIAAGTIINTAGLLQTQAEETSQDSSDQVADNINIIGEVADVNNASDEDVDTDEQRAYTTRLTVQRSPGSGTIDLSQLSIQYVGEQGFANLVHPTKAINGDDLSDVDEVEDVYLVEIIASETRSDPVLTEDADRYDLVIPQGVTIDFDGDTIQRDDLDGDGDVVETDDVGSIYNDAAIDDFDTVDLDNENLDLLSAGDEVEIRVTTDAGAQRTTILNVPDTLIGEEDSTVTL